MSFKKPLLTISLLISNRPDTIPRCLDSLHLLTDKLPCELILIDTSKSEEIHDLLLTYTEKVYKFEWCKDFAKARNEGVKRAKGEWFFFLDDDEWLVDVEEIVEFFQSKKYKNYQCANMKIRNFMNKEYSIYTESWATRLFYLGDGAKFEGKVHEYIYPIYSEPIYMQSYANHSGYVFDTEEERFAHFKRNEELLLDVLEQDPTNLRWVAQLIQEYHSLNEWKSIISLCKKHMKNVIDFSHYMQRNHFCTMYAGLVEGLTNTKEHKNALEVCQIGLEDERSTDLLRALLHFYSAVNYVQLKEWKKASDHLEKYFKAHEYFVENQDVMNEQLGALLVHRIFEEAYLEKASNILVYAELRQEGIDIPISDKDEDEQKEIELDHLSGVKFVRAMVNLLATMEYKNGFTYFLKNIAQNKTLCEWACAEVQQLENKDESAFQRCAKAFAKVESDFWYICYCRIMEADARNSGEDVESALLDLIRQLDIVCFMPDRVYEVVDKYDIQVALLWDKVAGEAWPSHIKRLVYECKDEYIDRSYDYLIDAFGQEDWRTMTLVSEFQEKMRIEEQKKEMRQLRDQIIGQVEVMYRNGQKEVAMQFLTQLKTMFPGDEEVEQLEKKIQE